MRALEGVGKSMDATEPGAARELKPVTPYALKEAATKAQEDWPGATDDQLKDATRQILRINGFDPNRRAE